MKILANNSLRIMLALFLALMPTLARAQGSPNILWMRGTHVNTVAAAYSPDGQTIVSGGI